MNKKVIAQIKEELLIRKEQILKDLKEFEENGDFPEYGSKPDENAQEVGDYATNIATEESLKSTLSDIEKALARIDQGTYGTCKYCQEKIGEKRLLARPAASACIECKTKLQD